MTSPLAPEAPADTPFICGCEEWMRGACTGEGLHGEHDGRRYCVLHFPGKEKGAAFHEALRRKLDDRNFNFAGVWFPDDISFSCFTFGTEADFSFATFSANANFSDVTFDETVDFSHATFSAKADFSSATFSVKAGFFFVTFGADVNFSHATFRGKAYFNSATFGANTYFLSTTFGEEINFERTIFSGETSIFLVTFNAKASFGLVTFGAEVNFESTHFNAEASFNSATFGAKAAFNSVTFGAKAAFNSATFGAEANFSFATFRSETIFSHAIVKDYILFAGRAGGTGFSDQSSLDFQFIRVEKPERVSFHTLTLRPHWFVNVDARKFDFTNVKWCGGIGQEIQALKDKGVSHPLRLLAIACRQLAVNAEENHRYEDASTFRHSAMDAQRRESRFGLAPWKLSWWYWLASGYGERVWRASTVLLGVWLMFAWFYTQVSFTRPPVSLIEPSNPASVKHVEYEEPRGMPRALTYSLGVMTLQKPEPRPETTEAQLLVALETVLGPVQAALLALAIRRKFMR